MKTIQFVLLIALLITLLISIYYFIYTIIYDRSHTQTWQMPMMLALVVDMILFGLS
jgi:hypothetical protein